MAGPVRIAILANGSQARREFASTSSAADGLGSKVGSVGKKLATGLAIGAAVAGAAVVKLGIDSVKAASDSQQSLGATRTVFGQYAGEVIANSKKAATALGLSANEYRELSNVSGSLLAGAGTPLKKVAGLTDDLNKRAADMAATFGGTTREAVESISSLLKGEADPIEKYGVSIKQSDVNARLAAKGLDGLTGSALKQAEQQARLDLLFQKTSSSAGAFGRESDTLANRQQILGAQFENIKAKIGAALLPVLTNLASYVIGTVVPAIERFLPTLRRWLTSAGEVATVLAQKLQPTLQAGKDMISSQLLPVVERIKQKFTEWRPTIERVGNIVAKVLPVLVRMAGTIAGQYYNSIVTGIDIIVKIVGKLIDFGNALSDGAGKVADFASKVRAKVEQVIGFFTDLPGNIKAALSGAKDLLVQKGKDIVQGLVDGLEAAKQWVIDKVKELADLVPGWLKRRLGIASPSKVTRQLGEWTAKGFGIGLAASTGSVVKAAQGFAQKAIDAIQKKIDSASSLRDSITSLRDQLAGALTGDLFGGRDDEAGSALDKFRESLAKAKEQAAAVANAVQKLMGAGVSGGFLQNLIQSGNSELIVQLAGAPDVASLAAQYDAVIAQNEDTGRQVAEAVIGTRLDVVNANLVALTTEMVRAEQERKAEESAQRAADKAERQAEREKEKAERQAEREKDREKGQKLSVTIDAPGVDQLSRGKGYKADITAYENSGGR